MPIPIEDLQANNPSAIIELFQMQLDQTLHGATTIYYWHDGTSAQSNGKLRFQNQDYDALPVKADGFKYQGQTGTLPRPKLTVSNLFGLITSILSTVNETTPDIDLIGAKVTRIRTLAKYIDPENFSGGISYEDHNQEFPREIYYVDRKAVENREVCEFELASVFDLSSVQIPKRVVLPSLFPGIGTFHG